MFGRNLLSRLLLWGGLKREFEDALQAHSYATISAINTAAADIVSTKMAESNFITTHELALMSDSIVREVATSTVVACTKIGDDIADDMNRALDSIRAIENTVDDIERTVENIESIVNDNDTVVLVEDIQKSLYDVQQKLGAILTWISNIDQKIDSQHAELYSALRGGLRVVYDPSLAMAAEKERDQELVRDLVKAGIMQEDANV